MHVFVLIDVGTITVQARQRHYTGQTTTLYRTDNDTIQDRQRYCTGQTTTLYRTDDTVQDRQRHCTGQTTTLYRTDNDTVQDRQRHCTGQTTTLYILGLQPGMCDNVCHFQYVLVTEPWLQSPNFCLCRQSTLCSPRQNE